MRALPRGQRAAESLMTLTLAVYEPNGHTSDDDGYDVQAYTTHASTRGKVQNVGSANSEQRSTRFLSVGGAERPVLHGALHIPIDATLPVAGVQRGLGWEYEVTAVGPLDDPALLGRRYLVVNVPTKSFATARRLDVVEV